MSVDSIFCHANWAKDLGGVSFPLLADFHPKGEMTRAYGLYLDDAGITDRATVVVDAHGVVRHASSVTPSGRRNIAGLAEICEGIDAEHGSGLGDLPAAPGLGSAEILFVKSNCGFSRKVLLARANLHLDDRLPVKNITEDPEALAELEKLTGNDQAPCLLVGGKPIQESDEIVELLVGGTAPLG